MKLEALASRLAEASRVVELDVDDELNPKKFDGKIEALEGSLSALAMKDATLTAVAGDLPLLYRGSLITTQNRMNVQVLVDTGASHVFTSQSMARSLPPNVWEQKPPRMSVKLPNGQQLWTQGHGSLLLQMGSWTGRIDCWILEMVEYDVILGRTWLAQIDPYISYRTSVMVITDQKGKHEITPIDSQPSVDVDRDTYMTVNAISVRQMVREICKKKAEAILFILKPDIRAATKRKAKGKGDKRNEALLPHEDKRIREILDQFAAVFREDLPDQMPPERDIVHDIETGTAAPVNKSPYPLSQELLGELKTQIRISCETGTCLTIGKSVGISRDLCTQAGRGLAYVRRL